MPDADLKLGLRERKKIETRKALAEAAIRLSVERGYDNVTVDDIAERAGVSTRTFFNYFPAKEDAVLRPDDDPIAETQRILDEFAAVPAEVGTFRAFATAMRSAALRIDREADEWLVRVSIIENDPGLIVKMFSARRETERMTCEAIAARAGVDPDDYYPALIFAAVGAAFQAAIRRWFAKDGDASVTQLFDEAIASIAAGLPQPKGEQK
ncbi:TetR family transcriptional regulator [Actinocrispum sp. NPDC049592]|uniref:acyl-CoA-like ligand-binding transcription factor n=1 Tax=Actinocrispum sp. NPDC049592 TaxID=3154835 RepID=UPI003418E671